MVRRVSCIYGIYASTSILTPDFSSMVMWSSQKFINGSGVAFQSCGFKPTDATLDDRFNSTIVPVEPSEHFIAFSADDDLGEAVIATIASFFVVGTGFHYSSADQFFLYL